MPGRSVTLRSLLVALPCAMASLSCGEGSFPEAAPCVAPSPTSTPRTTQQVSDFGYRRITTEGLTKLETLTANLRTQWPKNEPSNGAEFRKSYVTYVRDVTCLATDLKALKPRTEPYAAFEADFDAAMDQTVETAEFGQDAVKARNSSKYKDWIKKVDALPGIYEQAEAKLPSVTGTR